MQNQPILLAPLMLKWTILCLFKDILYLQRTGNLATTSKHRSWTLAELCTVRSDMQVTWVKVSWNAWICPFLCFYTGQTFLKIEMFQAKFPEIRKFPQNLHPCLMGWDRRTMDSITVIYCSKLSLTFFFLLCAKTMLWYNYTIFTLFCDHERPAWAYKNLLLKNAKNSLKRFDRKEQRNSGFPSWYEFTQWLILENCFHDKFVIPLWL